MRKRKTLCKRKLNGKAIQKRELIRKNQKTAKKRTGGVYAEIVAEDILAKYKTHMHPIGVKGKKFPNRKCSAHKRAYTNRYSAKETKTKFQRRGLFGIRKRDGSGSEGNEH